MNSIIIDYDKCTSCKTCVNVCFLDVIRWDEIEKKPIVAYEEDCVACNQCELECTEKCIKVEYGERDHIPVYY